jgi:hypothetical protein
MYQHWMLLENEVEKVQLFVFVISNLQAQKLINH